MIDIQQLNNSELVNLVYQIASELDSRCEVSSSLEVKDITDTQEYPDAFILNVDCFNDEESDGSYTITFTKEQIIELRNRLNQTSYQ